MRVLGLVPARGGSRRIERKNLAVLDGRTLVRRSLETALASGAFERVALSSEDAKILAEAGGLDVACVVRPSELAAHTVRTYDVALHALSELEGNGPRFDALAIVQCTSPFTAPADLSGAVELLKQSGADSVVSVVELDTFVHPLKLKRLEDDRLLPFLEDDRLLPSHELPPLWVRNGAVYVSRRAVIDRGELVGGDVRGFQMPRERSLDVDTPLDLAFAKFLLAHG